ncbi:MAG: CPBP family intramembrane metalloprotease [Bacteroidales bacterium]|jgi:membrane protease YdiL (CAAX protease family)|nr:CPBP family intramembrane metalloprotease [Bacteroidales bacterium]MBP8644173.1 CPBP family intramembrane metalloprotease [Bacteroidales bacterium]HRC93176.1 CPBP family intramembrane metalloprotease [Tenuifilaceae bacterium]
MRAGILSNLSDAKKIVALIILVLLGSFLFTLLGYLVIMAVYGTDSLGWLMNVTISNDTIGALKFLQIVQTIGMFVVPGFTAAWLFSSHPFGYLGFKPSTVQNFITVAVMMVISIPAINLLASINELIPLSGWMVEMERNAEILTEAFLKTDSVGTFLLNLLMIAILPAVGEEVIFRGILQKHLVSATRSRWLGILITAALFSAFHLQFRGFIPRFALGVIFGYLYEWSRSLWLPMLAHFTNNAIAVIAFLLMGSEISVNEIEEVGSLQDIWAIGIVSFLAVALLLRFIWKTNTRQSPVSQNMVKS